MTVPGGGFESLPPDSKKNLALILFFTTIQANFGLEIKTKILRHIPGLNPYSNAFFYLDNWSSWEDPVLHYFMSYNNVSLCLCITCQDISKATVTDKTKCSLLLFSNKRL